MLSRMPRLSFKIIRPEKHYTKIKDQIDLSISIVQAATMLDEVADRAIKKGDSTAMLGVAAGWMQLAAMLSNESEELEEEPEEVLTDTKVMGFADTKSREVMENAKKERARKIGL